MVSLIWAGHIILDRWSFIPSLGKRSYSSLASFRVFTIHNTLLYIATSAAISSYVFPVLSITNFTRRSLSCKANSFGMISIIRSIPSKLALGLVPSISPLSTGWLAVVNSTDTPNIFWYALSASTIGCKKSVGNVCASSKIRTEFTILCNLRQSDGLLLNIDSNSWTLVVTIIG